MASDFRAKMLDLVDKLRERCEQPGSAQPENCRCVPCWAAAVIEYNVIAKSPPEAPDAD